MSKLLAYQISQLGEGITKESKMMAQRANGFDHLLTTHWRPFTSELPERVGLFNEISRGYVSELKTRFLTNPNLSEEKLATLIKLVLYYERKIGKGDESIGFNTLTRLKNFLDIQIYTRVVEANVGERYREAIVKQEIRLIFIKKQEMRVE